MRALFITDLHGVTAFHEGLLQQVGSFDLLVVGGDLTSFGGAAEARAVLEPLAARAPRVLALQGNLDRDGVRLWLEEQSILLHGRGVMLGEVGLLGCGGSNRTPMHTPTELDEPEIAGILRQGHEAVASAPVRILVSHAPPFQTRTDRIITGKHVGSRAVREYIEESSPAACLCGHIHESAATDRLGETLVVNPGPFASGHYAVLEVGDDGRIECEVGRVGAGVITRVRAGMASLSGRLGFLRRR